MDATCHHILIEADQHESGIGVAASYVSGELNKMAGTSLASWKVDYWESLGEGYDAGQVAIGRGRIEISCPVFRGIGLGSLLMRPLVRWIKLQPVVPVCPINLAGADARSIEEQSIRNRFYEKLGFKFKYEDQGAWGESEPMTSDELITPPIQLSRGYRVKILSSGNLLES